MRVNPALEFGQSHDLKNGVSELIAKKLAKAAGTNPQDQLKLAKATIPKLRKAGMESAEIYVVLVTSAYRPSPWCQKEIAVMAKRASAEEARIIPVITEPCDWQEAPLGKFQAFPEDGRPIMERSDPASRAMIWMELASTLQRIVRAHRTASQSRREAILRPRIVALVGSEGIGRFTLARRLVHEPAPLTEKGTVDAEGFRALFADRSVLFIADQRTAPDMVPSLTEHAGPDCTVLTFRGRFIHCNRTQWTARAVMAKPSIASSPPQKARL